MWCLVQLPNNTTLGVQCEPKAIGQECLEKVCNDIGILCETDYFGLVHLRNADDASPRQWINLRNSLRRQGNGNDRGPLLLALRVKFWVPAHLILQESVRNLFYAQARQELLKGRLNGSTWLVAAKLSALLAQAEGLKYNSLCLSEQNELEIIKKNSLKSEESLGSIIENPKKHKVRPSKRKSSGNDLDSTGSSNKYLGIRSTKSLLHIYEDCIVRSSTDSETFPENYLQMIAKEHCRISTLYKTQSSAKYWLIEEMSTLNGYGEEIFEGVTCGETITKCNIGVEPHGLVIYKEEETFRIPFTAVGAAKSLRRTFRLAYLSEDHENATLEVKLSCHATAALLYRAITEKHAFYSCETVRSAVTTQFIRDLKGTIISMFNEDTELGKRYVFDIQRTCREVYDNSRRILHSRGIAIDNVQQQHQQSKSSDEDEDDNQKTIKEKTLLEALTCRICMDHEIETMFSPCGHVAACKPCSEKCDRCPLCRADIGKVNRIFLPGEFKMSSPVALPA